LDHGTLEFGSMRCIAHCRLCKADGLFVAPRTLTQFAVPRFLRADGALDISELVAGHPSLEVITSALLSVRAVLRRQLDGFEKRLRAIARTDTRARLLMATPGVGVIVVLTFACAIDDPIRFKSSKAVGAYFGMTLTRYQSGETDYSGRISKNGDDSVRAVLYEAAHAILTRPLKGCTALTSCRCGSPSGHGYKRNGTFKKE
jgi:transposase